MDIIFMAGDAVRKRRHEDGLEEEVREIMELLQTEFSFTLPKGYVDEAGTLHKQGDHASGYRSR
ncbi:hypothetical protein ACFSQ7_20800 [Paenibacillus rhizoplanae]